jgi:hypothetical protein
MNETNEDSSNNGSTEQSRTEEDQISYVNKETLSKNKEEEDIEEAQEA